MARALRTGLAVSAVALLSGAAFADTDEVLNIDTLGNGSVAYDVSGDGSTAVGFYFLSGIRHAFVWSESSQAEIDLGGLGGETAATGVSGDGSVVTGYTNDGIGDVQPFRWTQSGGMVPLGFITGSHGAIANAISSDGTTIVGGADLSNNIDEPFRWTQGGGFQTLGSLGGTSGNAADVSADGSVVVGTTTTAANTYEAFRWTQSGGMVAIGFLPGDSTSVATAVSADGMTIAGSSSPDQIVSNAFVWSATTNTMTALGSFGGTFTQALGISGNGKVVVGFGANASATEYDAFRWTAAGGLQKVTDWLAAANVTLPSGMDNLSQAIATNDDGSVIVGEASIPGGGEEAFYARVGGAGAGLLDPNTYNPTLAGAESVRGLGYDITNLDLNGAHHRSLVDSGIGDDGSCIWLTGDAASHDGDRSHEQLGELGGCFDMGAFRIGGAIGLASAQQSLAYAGEAHYSGAYLYGEVDDASSDVWTKSVSGFYGSWNTHIVRGYLNGAALDSSQGSPDASSWAIRGRVDRKDLFDIGALPLSPYVSYTHVEMNIDDYTETGGGLPAMFNAQHQRNDEMRLGAATDATLADSLNLRLYAEGAQRLFNAGGFVSGQVIGLFGFNLAGKNTPSTWLHGGVDLDWHVSEASVVSAGVAAATAGQDATVSGSLSWKMTF